MRSYQRGRFLKFLEPHFPRSMNQYLTWVVVTYLTIDPRTTDLCVDYSSIYLTCLGFINFFFSFLQFNQIGKRCTIYIICTYYPMNSIFKKFICIISTVIKIKSKALFSFLSSWKLSHLLKKLYFHTSPDRHFLIFQVDV